MLRASDIGNHLPHNVSNENDPLVRRSYWLNDSFSRLLLPDQIWGEAIKASRLTGGKNACIQGLHGDYIVIL